MKKSLDKLDAEGAAYTEVLTERWKARGPDILEEQTHRGKNAVLVSNGLVSNPPSLQAPWLTPGSDPLLSF